MKQNMSFQYIKSFPLREVDGTLKVSPWGRFRGAVLFLFVATLFFTACSDDDDKQRFDDTWRVKNEQKFDEIANNPEYTELKSPGNNGSIYYKVLKKGEGTQPIYSTSSVSVYYKGWYTVTHENRTVGDVFDNKLVENNPPMTTPLSGVVEGWQVALQHMVEGDKWEVWIPFRLGYGRYDSYQNNRLVMEGYATLAFEIEVVGVTP